MMHNENGKHHSIAIRRTDSQPGIAPTIPPIQKMPDDMLVYDREVQPVVSEYVLIISGPDKGRTGRLIGISEASGKGVVKVEYRGKKVEGFKVQVDPPKSLLCRACVWLLLDRMSPAWV